MSLIRRTLETPQHGAAARGLHRFRHLVRQSLAVGGAVTDDGHVIRAHFLHRELAQHLALLAVVGHHAESGL